MTLHLWDQTYLSARAVDTDEAAFQEDYTLFRAVHRLKGHLPEANLNQLVFEQRRRQAEAGSEEENHEAGAAPPRKKQLAKA